MKESSKKIIIDSLKCLPCSELICVDTCPWGVFQMGRDGKIEVVDPVSCTLCGLCENLCPNKAIKILREEP